MSGQRANKRASSSSLSGKEEEQQGLVPLQEKKSSSGIRSAAGQPVLCLHDGGTVLSDEDVRNRLLDIISGEFVGAFNLLPVKEHPELVARLYASGHCLGLLEPRSNILENAILHSGHRMDFRKSDSTKTWLMPDSMRRSCLQKQYWMVPAGQSLKGLIAFLRFYFRYMSLSQALRYLYLARCDLVLAIGLVESDLMNVRMFSFHEAAGVSIRGVNALHVATLAAEHPCADKVSAFAARRFRSYNADRVRSIMNGGPISVQSIGLITTLLEPGSRVEAESCVAVCSLRQEDFSDASAELTLECALIQMSNAKDKNLCDYSATLKKMLLDALYSFYMKSFECLAKPLFQDLQTALLRSGLCFGPFGDPVENILMNAIWFKNAFPGLCPELKKDLVHSEMISSLCRISLDAEVAFLCRKYTKLSSHDAILMLYRSCFNRDVADNLAMRKGHLREIDHHAAAIRALQETRLPGHGFSMAMFHSLLPQAAKDKIKSLLSSNHHKRSLNLHDFVAISKVLRSSFDCTHQLPPALPELSDKSRNILTKMKSDFEQKDVRLKRKLKRMIECHYQKDVDAKQASERLQMTKGSVDILCIFGGQRSFLSGKSFFHVNVLACDALKGRQPGYSFFFAQLWDSQHDDPDFDFVVDLKLAFRLQGQPLSSQFTVWSRATAAGRCLPCELAVTKIIHPVEHGYLGKNDENFVDSLDNVYKACDGDGDAVFESQCVYFNDHIDADLVEQLEGLDDEVDTFLPSD